MCEYSRKKNWSQACHVVVFFIQSIYMAESSVETSRLEMLKQNREKHWHYYGAPIKDYQRDFNSVLDGEAIYNFVSSRPSPVVVDLMAPSGTLVDLFHRLPKEKTRFGLAVSLEDLRTLEKRNTDKALGIEQIAGNLFSVATWSKIDEKLAGRKADLIMERALAASDDFPMDKRFFSFVLRKIWRMLSEKNGMILVQVPKIFVLCNSLGDGVTMERWTRQLHGNGIGASYRLTVSDGYLKLVKKPHSPKELPLPSKKT